MQVCKVGLFFIFFCHRAFRLNMLGFGPFVACDFWKWLLRRASSDRGLFISCHFHKCFCFRGFLKINFLSSHKNCSSAVQSCSQTLKAIYYFDAGVPRSRVGAFRRSIERWSAGVQSFLHWSKRPVKRGESWRDTRC